MAAAKPIPFRLTKLDLYQFLLKLHKREVEILVTTPWGEDGWQIRVNNHQSKDIAPICDSARVHQGGDHWALNATDYVIILARTGMDPDIQVLFDGIAMGRWVER